MAEDGKSVYKHACHTAASCHRAGCSEYPSSRKECSSREHGHQCILWLQGWNTAGNLRSGKCGRPSGHTAEEPSTGEGMTVLECHRG